MGCGTSTLEAEEPANTHHSNQHQPHASGPPVNKPIMKKDYDDDDDGVMVAKPLVDEEAKRKDIEGKKYNGERLKEKKGFVEMVKGKDEHGVNNHECDNGGKLHEMNKRNNNGEENHEDTNDSFIGRGSPSFREYCNDYGSVDHTSMGDSKNESDDNLTGSEKSVNSDKEPDEKKEKRGRRLRNVINKGKAKGRKIF